MSLLFFLPQSHLFVCKMWGFCKLLGQGLLTLLIRRGLSGLGLGCVQGFEVMDVTDPAQSFVLTPRNFFQLSIGRYFNWCG